MKKQILAYITGVINSYTTNIAVLTANGGFSTSLNTLVAIKGEFESLLEVVIDIPEENQETAILNFNLALENARLKMVSTFTVKTCEKFSAENCKLIQEREILKKDIACYKLSESIYINLYKNIKEKNKQ